MANELKELGSLPEKFKDQVSFYIGHEWKFQDIMDLGAKAEHLGPLAYGHDIFNTIYNILPVASMSSSSQCVGTATPG